MSSSAWLRNWDFGEFYPEITIEDLPWNGDMIESRQMIYGDVPYPPEIYTFAVWEAEDPVGELATQIIRAARAAEADRILVSEKFEHSMPPGLYRGNRRPVARHSCYAAFVRGDYDPLIAELEQIAAGRWRFPEIDVAQTANAVLERWGTDRTLTDVEREFLVKLLRQAGAGNIDSAVFTADAQEIMGRITEKLEPLDA